MLAQRRAEVGGGVLPVSVGAAGRLRTTASMTPASGDPGAVMRMSCAASGALAPSRQRMAAQPSGEITE